MSLLVAEYPLDQHRSYLARQSSGPPPVVPGSPSAAGALLRSEGSEEEPLGRPAPTSLAHLLDPARQAAGDLDGEGRETLLRPGTNSSVDVADEGLAGDIHNRVVLKLTGGAGRVTATDHVALDTGVGGESIVWLWI